MARYLITGCNRGIGLELCRQLSAKGNDVIAVCRKGSEALQQLPVQIIENIDVTAADDLLQLTKQLSALSIDVLVNNAGVWSDESIGAFKPETMTKVFMTNALAPLMVTEQLLTHLQPGAKVVMITSRMGSIGDNTSGGRYSYRMSKAALNAASKSLSLDLRDKGISLAIIHPGHVATDMGGINGIPVEESVSNILQRIDDCDLSCSGQFKHANSKNLPW